MASVNRHCLGAYLSLLYQVTGKRVFIACLLLLLSGITEGIGLMLLVPLLNVVITGHGMNSSLGPPLTLLFKTVHLPKSLALMLLLGLTLIVLRVLLARRREIILADLRFTFMSKLQISLFQAAQATRWEHWLQQRNSRFLHVLTTEIPEVGQGTYYFLSLAVTTFLTLAYLIVAMRLSVLLTTGVLFTGVILFRQIRGYLRRSYQLGQSIEQVSDALYACLDQFFGGLKLAKSHGEGALFTSKLVESVTQLQRIRFSYIKSRENMKSVLEIGGASALCGFIYVATAGMNLAAPEIMLLILIFARLMPMVSRIFSETQQVVHMLPAFQSVMDTLQACQNAVVDTNNSSAVIPLLRRSICFQTVSVRYETDRKPALSGINCNITAYQTTALIGSSGSGKTTFADVLTGLVRPESGQVLIDDIPLDSRNAGGWGRQISYVTQDPFFFYGTIRENLIYMTPGTTDLELWQALELAAADIFVRNLPAGLNTRMGDHGVTLSGGERQRLALARALLRKPALLILDEPTSALDSLNEQHICTTLRRLHGTMTILLITHRLAALRQADQIILLRKGKIGGAGSWQEVSTHGQLNEFIKAYDL